MSNLPEAAGSPCRRALCNECASKLMIIWKMGGRWGVCSLCDAGWKREPDSGRVTRVGPPALLRVEEQKK